MTKQIKTWNELSQSCDFLNGRPIAEFSVPELMQIEIRELRAALAQTERLTERYLKSELAHQAQTEQPEHCGNKSCAPGYCYCEQPAQGEREKFESAYRKLYPLACDIRPNKFELGGEGDYAETIVNVAWNLWQAALLQSNAERGPDNALSK